MINQSKINELVKVYQKHDNDVGSYECQIITLTFQINNWTEHLRSNKKDFVAKRMLLEKVAKRKKFLKKLYLANYLIYQQILKDLNLREQVFKF